MHCPTPLRIATFAASILVRAVLVNQVAAWLQTQGIEATVQAVFMQPSAAAPCMTGVARGGIDRGARGKQCARGTRFNLAEVESPNASR